MDHCAGKHSKKWIAKKKIRWQRIKENQTEVWKSGETSTAEAYR